MTRKNKRKRNPRSAATITTVKKRDQPADDRSARSPDLLAALGIGSGDGSLEVRGDVTTPDTEVRQLDA
jgi:hypothetical protein